MDQVWMLVRKGLVQRIEITLDGKKAKAWPVAESHADAIRLVGATGTGLGKGDVRASMVGSVQGETLMGHIEMAIEEGCKYMICVDGWNADGKPRWKVLALFGN